MFFTILSTSIVYVTICYVVVTSSCTLSTDSPYYLKLIIWIYLHVFILSNIHTFVFIYLHRVCFYSSPAYVSISPPGCVSTVLPTYLILPRICVLCMHIFIFIFQNQCIFLLYCHLLYLNSAGITKYEFITSGCGDNCLIQISCLHKIIYLSHVIVFNVLC